MKSNGRKTKSKAILNSLWIPPGYKQTEVGVIPEDWEVKPLRALADKIMVGIASAATHAYRDKGIVLFRNQNIKPGYLDDSDILYITPDYEASFKNKRLKAGDLLTARTGYPGTTCVVTAQYEGAQSFTTLITRPNHRVVDPGYLCFYINSDQGQAFFERNQIGGGQKNVNAGSLEKLPIPLPPTKAEQEAIAEVLSDADALIISIERLIAGKAEFKHGLMQQLLAGRKRFREFKGQEWKQFHLGDVATESELRNNGRLTEKSLYAVTKAYGMIPMRERVQGESVERCKVVSKDWFAYNPMRLNIGSIAKWNNEDDVLVSPDYVVFRCDETRLDPDFLNHYRQSHRWTKFVEKSGDGSVRVRIWFSHLAELKLSLPPLPEQRRIATILNDCDRELDLLREQLVEFKKQKQGLMQKLLTSRIRVKIDEAQAIGV